jgi:hypothetical protein
MRLWSWHSSLPTSGFDAAYPCTMTGKMGLINGPNARMPSLFFYPGD